MERKQIQPMEWAPLIMKKLPGGVLLTSAADGKEDTMTIGWGTIGIEWGVPIFTVFVRESRYTRTLLDQNGAFTVNVALEDMDVRKILGVCGSVSGRDHNKFEELNLHKVPGVKVNVPAIAELPLTLECEVIYRQDQDPQKIPEVIQKRFYATGDYHTAYYGKIVDAYILEAE